MKTTALYARVSSEKQDVDLSISAQLKALREYVHKHGYQIVREFVDEAESGRTADRPVFQEMIALARRKPAPFDTILVWKLARFARNREDSIIYKSLLRKHGVQVVSINEPVDNSPTGKMLEGIIEVIDEFYSANLAQEVTRGMREAASRGYWVSAGTPYGYRRVKIRDGDVERAKLELEPEAAAVVKHIFALASSGMGVVEITKRLNAEGIASPRGRRWGKGAVHNVLVNPVYAGTLVWGKSGHYHRSAGLTPVTVESAFPAVVDRDTYETVQVQLRSRGPKVMAPRTVSSRYLLSGLLRCGECGSAMSGQPGKSGRYLYYVCATKTRVGRGICRSRPVPANTMEDFVLEKVRDVLLEDDHVEEMVRLVNEEMTALRSDLQGKTRAIQAQITEVTHRLDRLYDVLETGRVSLDDLAPRIKSLSGRRGELEQTMSQLERQNAPESNYMFDRKAVTDYLRELKAVLRHGTASEQKAVLRCFVRSVVKSDAAVTVNYTAPSRPVTQKNEAVPTLVQSGGAEGT
ncbi:MAG: recombinase family protein [SAR202 cluster bacterium]|nr:recombinase family protein [SAR202 cluster bacterium]